MCCCELYVEGTAHQVHSGISVWFDCVTLNTILKLLRSRWTSVLQDEFCVLQWELCGRYFTAGGHRCCSLNWVCYNEHYEDGTSKLLDIRIVGWMECVSANIIWKILHSRWTVVLQNVWCVLGRKLFRKYFTAFIQCYCSLNGVCYCEHYVEVTSQQVDSSIAGWVVCVTANIIRKLLQCMLTVFLQFEWSLIHRILCGI